MPPAVVVGTDVFDRFLDENDLRDVRHRVCDDDGARSAASSPRRCPRRRRARPRGVPATSRGTRWRCAPRACSRTRSTSRSPASTRPTCCRTTTPSASARLRQLVDGDQARLRLDLHRARQGLPARHAVPPRGGEDGGRSSSGWSGAPTAGASTPTSRAWRARTTSTRPRPLTAEDGIAAVALGLGRERRRRRARACASARATAAHAPVLLREGHPERTRSATSGRSTSPRRRGRRRSEPHVRELRRFGLEVAEHDGTLAAVGSTYSPENDAVYDGHRRGRACAWSRFAPILKHGVFPLAEILATAARRSASAGMGRAGRDRVRGEPVGPGPAQPTRVRLPADAAARPRARRRSLEIGELDAAAAPLPEPDGARQRPRSTASATWWSSTSTASTAAGAARPRPRSARLNAELVAAQAALPADRRRALGLGRPLARHPGHLGPDLRRARHRRGRLPRLPGDAVAGEPLLPEPDRRSSVGYFTVNPESGEGFVDWDWLAAQPASEERAVVRHLRFEAPRARPDERPAQRGLIFKPAKR